MSAIPNLNLHELDERIGYSFQSEALRLQAVTHTSALSHHQSKEKLLIYERLEFLGDSVVGWVIAEQLYKKLPDKDEGVLTQLRARVVSRPSLALAAKEIGLDQFLRIGKSEEKNGLRSRPSILANSFESLIGAIFLDSDATIVRDVVIRLLSKQIEGVLKDPRDVNPKGELQIALQSMRPELPVYQVEELPEGGYFAQVFWLGKWIGEGKGISKQKAQIAAAADALTRELPKE